MSESSIKTAERLVYIIDHFMKHDEVYIHDLKQYTDKSIRTIQDDLNCKLPILGVEKIEGKKGYYRMNRKYAGLFTAQELKAFSIIAGVSEIFPQFDSFFLGSLIENKFRSSILVKSPFKGSMEGREVEFEELVRSIDKLRKVRLSYTDGVRYTVDPYKLLNIGGRWYLCAVDNEDNKLKTFTFEKIQGFRELSINYEKCNSVLEIIEGSDTVWMGNKDLIEVVLKVKESFKEFFREKITIPGLIDYEETDIGDLIVKGKLYFLDEIKGIVKYWLPNIDVLSPIYLKDLITDEIVEFTHRSP